MELNSWFECKVKMDVMKEGGITKPETSVYLVDALNFTEAETRILEETAPLSSGNIEVANINKVKYAEIFPSDSENADKWYKVRCMFITYDEKTEKEKEIGNNMLVQAANFHDALKNFDAGMKGSMMDYRISSIQETKIMDVYKFVVKTRTEGDAKPEYEG